MAEVNKKVKETQANTCDAHSHDTRNGLQDAQRMTELISDSE